MRTAAQVLGRPHRVDGVVERGDERGRELGFPTANLRTDAWAAVPADGVYALEAVRSSGGAVEAVTDDEIVDGIILLARSEGIFAETAGGVTIATLAKLAAQGVVRPDERVVAYITGNGLKTIDAVAPTVGPTATRS